MLTRYVGIRILGRFSEMNIFNKINDLCILVNSNIRA
nr:MAG TPA: hypothetical protein [Caudoviricetes sp.]